MKHRAKMLICIISLLAAMSIALEGRQADDIKHGKKQNITESTSHKTVFFELKTYDCPVKTGVQVNRRFFKKLGVLPNMLLIKNTKPCRNADCAVKNGRTANSDRVLFGYVSLKTITEKKSMGNVGAEKYILKVETKETYHIEIKLADVETGNVIASVAKQTRPEELDATIDKMAAELTVFYTPKKIQASAEIIPEEKDIPVTGEKDTSVTSVKEADIGFKTSMYFSFMFPTGRFRDMTSFSAGNIVEGSVTGMFEKNTDLRISLGYYYISSASGDVTSYRSIYSAVSAGYRFRVAESLTIVPLLGSGFHVHFVRNRNYSGTHTYTDPLVSLRSGLDYAFFSSFTLSAAAGYVVFFENSNTGMYPVLDIGLKYAF